MTKKKTTVKGPKRIPDSNKENTRFRNIALPAFLGAVLGSFLVPGIGGVALGGAIGSVIGSTSKKDKKMAKVPVFYSFHFDNDVMRVQQIRNIGSIEGNPPTTPNEWEQLKRTGAKAVENWIDQNMKYKRCIVVLIGSHTAERPWVKHEIIKAWNSGKALLGIHIHNLKCPRTGTSKKGKNPFDQVTFKDGTKLSSVIPCYDPNSTRAYNEISENLSAWINHAIQNKAN